MHYPDVLTTKAIRFLNKWGTNRFEIIRGIAKIIGLGKEKKSLMKWGFAARNLPPDNKCCGAWLIG